MNLFVVGWGSDSEQRSRATHALREMHSTFPLLDVSTVGTWSSKHTFAAWLHVSDHAAGPRRYVHRTADELVLYDGTAVDPNGRIAGHDASSLASHWSELTEVLEGRFAAVRIDGVNETLEVLNDPYGVHPTFWYRSGNAWWLANSVRLLVGVAGQASLDMVGMARCIGMSWPGHDRTLVEGIAALPAGQRWHWSSSASLQRTTYAAVTDLAAVRKRSFGAREAGELAGVMGNTLEELARTFAPLQCPITAGRDSRMLTGLMVARGLSGEYFTAGDAESLDVKIGMAVADRLALPYSRSGGSGAEIAATWDALSRRVVQRNDGMVTLAHARNALIRPEQLQRLIVQLYGAAGELGRGKRFTERFVLRRPTLGQAIALAQRAFDGGGGLVRPEARELVRDHIARACTVLHQQGFDVTDVPDAFDLSEYGRRWAGSQARQIVDHKDVVLPFVTRHYMVAAFATPPIERLMERLPFELLKHLSPTLHALPFQRPWPPQHLALFLLGRVREVPSILSKRVTRRLRLWSRHTERADPGKMNDRMVVFERQRSAWRERYLDRRTSSLWQIIDRDRFEYLTSDRATPSQRMRHHMVMYQALTALAYEEDLESWVDWSSSHENERAMPRD